MSSHDHNADSHESAIPYPIDGTLDLHIFPPSEVRDLVPEYLRECRQRGIYTVRIVHGKGTGALRRTVHAVLEKLAWVRTYHLAGPGSGSWGATIAHLEPVRPDSPVRSGSGSGSEGSST